MPPTGSSDYLTLHGGSADSALIKRDGAKDGHSKDALQRCRRQLGIVSTTSGFPRRAFWSLPTVDAPSGESASNALTASTASTEPPVDALGAVGAVNGTPPRECVHWRHPTSRHQSRGMGTSTAGELAVRGVDGRRLHTRIKGRQALVRRLRGLLVAVHRFGRGRARTREELAWYARTIDALTAALEPPQEKA